MPNIDPATAPPGLYSAQVIEARRFFIELASTTRTGIVLGGGYERVDATYTIDRRGIPFTAIELVVAGEGLADLGGTSYPLIPGTLFVYGSNTPHRLTTSPKRTLVKYFLDLSGSRAVPMMKSFGLLPGNAWQVQRWLYLARLFEEMVQHGCDGSSGRQAVCDALLRALLTLASQSLLPNEQVTDAFVSYQACCMMIDTRFARIRSLHQLSTLCELDAAYICRLFQRFDRESPYRRLMRKRMTYAATELCSAEKSVRDVAVELGYVDPFHFSRAFKAVTGFSPRTFKQMHGRRAEVIQ